jgi:hypothetical protein
MTIGRGLLRLWVVLSVCWVLAIGAITLWTLPLDISSDDFDPDAFLGRCDRGSSCTIYRRNEQIKNGSVLAFAPPIGVLILGLAFAWVARVPPPTAEDLNAPAAFLGRPMGILMAEATIHSLGCQRSCFVHELVIGQNRVPCGYNY